MSEVGHELSPSAIMLRAILGCTAIIAWLALFTFGITIGTTAYMRALDPDNPQNQPPTWEQAIEYWRLVNDRRLPQIEPAKLATLKRDDFAQYLATVKGDVRSESISTKSAARVMTAKPVIPPTFAQNGETADMKSPSKSDATIATPESKGESPSTTSHEPESAKKIPDEATNLALNTSETSAGENASSTVSESSQSSLPAMVEPPLRDNPGVVRSWLGVFFCNTIVNLGLLSCLASTIGTLYYSTLHPANGQRDKHGPQWYLSGLTQGFVVYLAVLAGLLVLGEVPVENVTTQKYVHLAGAISALSFWAGYSPNDVIVALLQRTGRAQSADHA